MLLLSSENTELTSGAFVGWVQALPEHNPGSGKVEHR